MKTAELSELRNAEQLIEKHGADLRWSPGSGWMVWNGQVWEASESAVKERGKETLRTLLAQAEESGRRRNKEAAQLLDAGDETGAEEKIKRAKGRAGLIKWYTRSQGKRGIDTMMSLAESDGRIFVDGSVFDADPYVLNVGNGILDLRTGELWPHDRGALCTKQSPVLYDPCADMGSWLSFIDGITGGDIDMARELQDLAGYSLIGGPNEQELFVFMIGLPGSGKGTLVESIRSALGTYATTTAFDSFLKRSTPQELRPDLHRLKGARMVSASEVDEGSHIDEGLLSTWTGRDYITARTLHRKAETFLPQCTLWFMMNTAPKVNANKDATGFWRRVYVEDFAVRFGALANPNVKTWYTSPAHGGPAVLRWCVEGAVRYLASRKPIAKCARSMARADKYRDENDPLAEFLSHYLAISPVVGDGQEYILKSRFQALYSQYCEDENINHKLSAKRIKAIITSPPYGLREKFLHASRSWAWMGARERRMSDDVAAEEKAS